MALCCDAPEGASSGLGLKIRGVCSSDEDEKPDRRPCIFEV